jgi:hypothetical protein
LPGAFLLHNAEENLKTAVSLAYVGRALNGGVNDNQFPRWLDVRSSYAAFSALLAEWSAKVRRWRCGLSPANCAWLGVSSGWKCDTFVDRVSFERPRAAVLDAVATRLALPADQVDFADRRRRRGAAQQQDLPGLPQRALTGRATAKTVITFHGRGPIHYVDAWPTGASLTSTPSCTVRPECPRQDRS